MMKVKYHNIRLPDNLEIIREYVKEAVYLDVDASGKILELKLLRLLVDPKPIPDIGCFIKKEFPLINY